MKLINHEHLLPVNREVFINALEYLKCYQADLMRKAACVNDRSEINAEIIALAITIAKMELSV